MSALKDARRRWLWIVALLGGLVWGCDSGGGGTAPAGLRVDGEGLGQVDQLRLVIKRTASGDAGGGGRVVTDNLLAVSGEQLRGSPLRVPAEAMPVGDGPAFVHAVALFQGAPVGIGDGAADGLLIVRPYAPECDRDGDTYLDCDQGGCCQSLAPGLTGEVSDCQDDPAIPAPMPPDAKRRDAATAHPFAPRERGDDYETCGNGVDDDCVGGDRPCDRADEDGDGVTLGDDCDDDDPQVGRGLPERGGNGVDDDCDGVVDEATDLDGDGYAGDDADPARRDCDDADPRVHPFRAEVPCNGVDEDCSGDDRCVMDDVDGDGIAGDADCDDFDAGAFPGAAERCGDGVDQDCDGADLPCAAEDVDGDGFAADDCGEGDPRRYPGAPERCGDGVDQDCDGADLPCFADADGDGYDAPADCDDAEAGVSPEATELCDRVDNDCDGRVDEGNPLQRPGGPMMPATCGTDVGICQTGPQVCARAEGPTGTEILCLAVPPEEELCDGLDNDCDGAVDQPPAGAERMADEGVQPCGPEREVGACRRGLLFCEGGALADCRGAVVGDDEICNERDDDCDARIDEGEGGGVLSEPCFDGPPEAANRGLCREGQRTCDRGEFSACEGQLLPAEEGCNGLDDDCDGEVDEGLTQACYSFDPDTEGVGSCRPGGRRCVDGAFGACEDEVGPGAEICNDRDDDCDGRIDQFSEDCFGEPGQMLDRALVGVGLCEAGFRSCRDGQFGQCQGDVVPRAEICDRLDNDCDGEADEDFDLINDPRNCRECGRQCRAGEGCCFGACRPLNTPENCGACGVTCEGIADRCAQGPGGAECRCGDGAACEDGLRCVGGSCRCVDDGDCGEGELCCDGACEPTGPDTQCERCGVACDPGLANACVNRECRCGAIGECPPETVCTQDGGAGAFLCRGCGRTDQCPANARCCGGVCTPTSAATNCEDCGQGCDPEVADFCRGAEGQEARLCTCGQAGVACPDRMVCVFGLRAGEGRCEQCRDDADCARDYPGRPRCVDNVCQACNPRDHGPCGQDELCCGFQCVATGAGGDDSCERCGVACEQEQTNRCADRDCGCGGADPCDPASDTPLCDDGRGLCVQCRADVDCAGHPNGGQCVDDRCVACDPGDHAGCLPNQLCCAEGGDPSCQEASVRAGQCQGCDVACAPLATDRCSSRRCRCGVDAPCAGDLPVCDDGVGECVECTNDAHCNDHPNGSQCVDRTCQQCDPEDHAGCAADQLCCDDAGLRCQGTGPEAEAQCERCDEACAVTAVDRCAERGCACGDGPPCAGGTPFCLAEACVECRNQDDCGADELCCGGVCQPTGGGPDEQCERCGVACDQAVANRCGARLCLCGGVAACAGDQPLCRRNDRGNALGCVQCLGDGDCGDFAGDECVAFQCEACDPEDHAGCAEGGATPICDAEDRDCRICANDAECGARPGPRNECVGGGCQRCDPADNAGCPAAQPICDPERFSCRACEGDAECGGGQQCVEGRCRGCDPGTDEPCAGVTPICGADFACRACADDGECLDRPGAEDQCVEGQCRACDPDGHAGCAAGELCCGFRCVAVGVEGCPACNVPCDADNADRCVDRTCQCGDAAACGGQTPFCDDGDCVNCRDDQDCAAGRPECVGLQCERCDPNGDAGCDGDGVSPICDAGNLSCRACARDAECVGNANGEQCLADGSCGLCDPRDDAGCGGRTPICLADGSACRGCAGDAECAGNERCVEAGPLAGACAECDPDDGAGCQGGAPICDRETAECRGCEGNNECGDVEAPACLANGTCRACNPEDDFGCAPASTRPICTNPQSPRCSPCGDDADCAGRVGAPGGQCIVAGATAGSCQACDPADHAGCDPAGANPTCDGTDFTCRPCRADAECGGGRPFCVEGQCRECVDDAACTAQVCEGNACADCGADADCRDHPFGAVCGAGGCGCDAAGDCRGTACEQGRCVLCRLDGDCVGNPFGTICGAGIAGVCGCNDGPDCGARVCRAASCRDCQIAVDCLGHPAGPHCGAAAPGACGCRQDSDCGALVCDNGACAPCGADADCAGHPRGPICAAAAAGRCGCADQGQCGLGACVDNECGNCAADADCAGHPAGSVCGAGQAGACGCDAIGDCGAGQACVNNRCEDAELGGP